MSYAKCQWCGGSFPSEAKWVVEQYPADFGPATSTMMVCRKHVEAAACQPLEALDVEPLEVEGEVVEPPDFVAIRCKVRKVTYSEMCGRTS